MDSTDHEDGVVRCRFGDGFRAAVRVSLSDGCLCYPDDREQDLCIQHLDRANPLGEMEVIKDYGVWDLR